MTERDTTVFFTDMTAAQNSPLSEEFARALELLQGNDRSTATDRDIFNGIAAAVRAQLMRPWLETRKRYIDRDVKQVYYLSMEFLMGRLLSNTLLNLDCESAGRETLEAFGYDIDEIAEQEPDMGLGNGGLGRLAACFLDSMASQGYPAHGYGLRYRYGIFRQIIRNGEQHEQPDEWLSNGCPWEVRRPEHSRIVQFGGRVEPYRGNNGETLYRWTDTDNILAQAFDIPVPGYHNNTVNTLRLWDARSTDELGFSEFNKGNYLRAVEDKIHAENITRVLYPDDTEPEGKELRLRQQFFFVSSTLQDILDDFFSHRQDIHKIPEKIGIQLNDTHPALAIPELMRLLLDIHLIPWEPAWEITRKTFSYTNHTVLPEALETWDVDFIERLLPRHLQIIEEIDRRFSLHVSESRENSETVLRNISIFGGVGAKTVRMASLSVIGSHAVNGVSALHTDILKQSIFRHFDTIFPDKISAQTNGITHRRWIMACNRPLTQLITDTIGSGWKENPDQLEALAEHADNRKFHSRWNSTRKQAKRALADWLAQKYRIRVNTDTLFDIHVKRFHEYKRQLLNVLHVIARYNRIRNNPDGNHLPRTVFFGGKAAPGYDAAKLIIRLILSVADVINNDPAVAGLLSVVFVPEYSVSAAEKMIPAADLSEQISVAGYEASGTGNMKFMLNGALTIGTMDGANVEMADAAGKENMFIFGLNTEAVARRREDGYDPAVVYNTDSELKQVLNMIRDNVFCPKEPGAFTPIFEDLVTGSDTFMLCADFRSYLNAQDRVDTIFRNQTAQTRMSILNTAAAGRFSSDATIRGYANDIWHIRPQK